MLTHCCIGYLKVTYVQNDHHQCQGTVDSGVGQSSIILLLLVEQSCKQFRLHAPGPAVFVVLWHEQCYLEYPVDKSLKVRKSRWILYTFCLSRETNIEKVSHISVVMQSCIIMFKAMIFVKKQNVDARCDDVLQHC